ncbi:MAG: hypothetical protein AB7W59_09010 [Acidimicrobiia bacterium]
MVARPARRHPYPSLIARAAAASLAAVLVLSACSGDDSALDADPNADAKPTADGTATTLAGATGSTAVAGPTLGTDNAAGGTDTSGASAATVTAPPTTEYVVPDIPAASVAEICAGTTQIVEADTRIGELLGPALAADASDAADAALLQALNDAKPLIDQAQAGYDRLAAVLPGELATDAAAVRDATLTFYGAVTATQTMDGLIAVIGQAQQYSDAARESAARLDATTRKTCNQSLYNA